MLTPVAELQRPYCRARNDSRDQKVSVSLLECFGDAPINSLDDLLTKKSVSHLSLIAFEGHSGSPRLQQHYRTPSQGKGRLIDLKVSVSLVECF